MMNVLPVTQILKSLIWGKQFQSLEKLSKNGLYGSSEKNGTLLIILY